MKNKYIVLITLVSLFIFSSFISTTLLSTYALSSPDDLSFGNRLVYHEGEISALDNYFLNVDSDPLVREYYNSIMNDFSGIIFEQRQYMDDNNITFDQIRDNPSIIPINFKLSTTQSNKINYIINKATPVASPDLAQTLDVFSEYINLVPVVSYSQLEIYKDATGDDLSLNRNSSPSQIIGLQGQEAVRKLRDLLRASINDEKAIIFPNPADVNSSIMFNNSTEGNVSFRVFDVSGKEVSRYQENFFQGPASIKGDKIIQTHMSSGIYFLLIESTNGSNISQKLIIK